MKFGARLISSFARTAVLAALLTSHHAAAQDDATVEMARQRFKEGVTFFDQRQYEKARLAFLQAYALKPHPTVLLNLAQSELRANQPADAAQHFSEYLRTNSEASEAERQEAELGFAAARTKAGEITVATDVDGAEVTVDGQPRGRTPLGGPLYVLPGARSIELRSGDKRAVRSVNAAAGQSMTLSIPMGGGAAAAAGPTATTPTPAPEPVPEEEDAQEPLPVNEPEEPEADVQADTSGRMNFFKWWVSTPIAIVMSGVGVAGLAGGTIFALGAKSDYDTANRLKGEILAQRDRDQQTTATVNGQPNQPLMRPDMAPCDLSTEDRQYIRRVQAALGGNIQESRDVEYDRACGRFNDATERGDSSKTLAIVGFAVGGAGIAGTVIYYFVDPKAAGDQGSSKRPAYGERGSHPVRASVAPVMTPWHQGLVVQGTF